MNFLAIILARGGSKGIPGKNIKSFCDKPLISWTIRQANHAKIFTKIVVSSDSKDIIETSLKNGAEAPFIRPKSLSQDNSSSIDAIYHCLDFYEKNGVYFDAVCLLEPTSPLRTPSQLKAIINSFIERQETHDSLITVGKIRESVEIFKKLEQEDLKPYFGSKHSQIRRQESKQAYFPYGVAYISKIETLRKEKTFYSNRCTYYQVDDNQCFEIDEIYDFEVCEFLFKRYFINLQKL
ncbi:acylneuraminate cytidylyltransferase family protein [Candidatus Pseudothioglobus singularis]|nr:acylneuraminate cytidylyltransferase family protein [Candidatus Pseudothioglobus singularis]